MELRNLITFIHVADSGSFTKSAEQLGYSQSTISFQIKQLEDECGCLLFERVNHTVSLTENGSKLVSYAHRIISLQDEFKDSISKERECKGHIHIVTPDSICENMVTTKYMDFHNKYPSISLKFTTADTSIMLDMLDHNEADIIITLDDHIYNKDYIIANEEHLPMHFVTNSSSVYAGTTGLSIRDIANEPFVLSEFGQGYRKAFDRELEKKSLQITPVLELGRTDIITSVLTQSNMISFLPDFVTQDQVKSGKLCYLDVCDMNIDICKQLIYHKNKWVSKSLRAFIDYAKKAEFSV